jgi:phosphomannomutase
MIVFGTDGWRGLIARDFTFENVRYVALATARYLKKVNKENPTCVIGYDTRFLSREFAEESALVLAWQGITVHLCDDIASTPQVSYHPKQKGADFGVVITASHNPPEYSGFKLKGSFGGPATPDQVAELEKHLKNIMARPPQFKFKDLEFYTKNKKIRLFNAQESYLRYLKKKINFKAIKDAGFKILFDPMYGAGINTLHKLLPDADEIHADHNPSFGTVDHPEPIGSCLGELCEIIKNDEDYQVGLATDGDADRLGAVDEDGNYVDAQKVYMIILKYLYEVKKKRGAVAKTVSVTSMVDKFCEKNKIKMHETPVGFKHIAKLMIEEKILIGGEESGGLSTIIHIPERDGIFNGMLLLEIMAVRGLTLKELSDELEEEFGVHKFMRRDVRVSMQQKKQITKAIEKMPKKLGRFDVIGSNLKDGYKFFVDGGWLLIRASGTEPLFRFYAEANTITKVNQLLDAGQKLK